MTKPTPWCAELVAVPEVSHVYRTQVDLTKLNKEHPHESNVVLMVKWVRRQLGDVKVLPTLGTRQRDLRSVNVPRMPMAYHVMPFRRYSYCLAFRLTNTPDYIFQREIIQILEIQLNVVKWGCGTKAEISHFRTRS